MPLSDAEKAALERQAKHTTVGDLDELDDTQPIPEATFADIMEKARAAAAGGATAKQIATLVGRLLKEATR